jgi:hypothetical protein
MAAGCRRCETTPQVRPAERVNAAGPQAVLQMPVLPRLKSENQEVRAMRDIVFMACSVGFFVVAIAYVWGCERLK